MLSSKLLCWSTSFKTACWVGCPFWKINWFYRQYLTLVTIYKSHCLWHAQRQEGSAAKVFSTILETLGALKIKTINNRLKLSIWVGFTAGPNTALDLVVMKKRTSVNTETSGINRKKKKKKKVSKRSQNMQKH